MEQHQVAEIEDRNEKEEIVSCSPDSGINVPYEDGRISSQSDLQPEKAPNAEKRIQCPQNVAQNSLYPFYYKYPDNRKLTLLKSLSQDSEYSLDASLFDAEGFLQEMGFAGSCDPIIPDRFLPSLIQRLAQFPESEMVSLNDRIVQSIGCFRRKEGKRRLFRNLSIGKDPHGDQSDSVNLSCPNNYPLLRSNTGPAAFSFDDPPLATESTESSRYSKLISNESGNSSFAEDDLPTSPIAILVSAASIDADQEETQSEESPSHDLGRRSSLEKSDLPIVDEKDIESCELGDVSEAVDIDAQDNTSNLELSSKQDDTSNFTPKQLNTDTFSQIVDREDQNKESVQENQKTEIALPDVDEYSVEGKSTACSFQTTFHETKPFIEKQPLRRLSDGPIFYPQNFSLARESKIDFSDFTNNLNGNGLESVEKPDENDSFNTESINADSSIEYSESSTSVSVKDDSESIDDVNEQESVTIYETTSSIESFSPVNVNNSTDSFKRSKPIYTRDDSLSNFLSSMLNTNEESLSPQSPTASQVFTFDSKEINNERRNNEKCFEYSSKHSDKSSECVQENPLSPKYKNEDVKIVNNSEKDNLPNRKRRLLRRMSSSFNYADEEVPPTAPESLKNKVYTSSSSSPSVKLNQSKHPIYRTFHTPMISSCPIIYPCCCLPSVKVPSISGCQRNNVSTFCDNPCCSHQWHNNVNSQQIQTQASLPNRKFKRCCKRGRYLSCPPSMNNYGCKTCFHQQNFSKSTQNLCTETPNYFCRPSTSLHSKSFTAHLCRGECFSNCEAKTSSKDYLSDPQDSESFRNDHYMHSKSHLSPLCQDITHKYRNTHPVQNKWRSTPDVRHEYFGLPNTFEYKKFDTKTNNTNKLSNEYSYLPPFSREINTPKDFVSSKSEDFSDFGLNRCQVFPQNSSPKKPSSAKTNNTNKLSNEYSYLPPFSREINTPKDFVSSKSEDFSDFGFNRCQVFPQNSSPKKPSSEKTNNTNKLSNEYSYLPPFSREINTPKDFVSSKSEDFSDFGLNRCQVFPQNSSPKKPSSAVRDFQDEPPSSLYSTQFLSSSKRDLSNVMRSQNLSPTSQYLSSETNYSRNMPLRSCISYPLQKTENLEIHKHNSQRRSSYVDPSSLQDSTFFQNIKREALMEKKIRVFSKFLTNLGNLTKSIPNDKGDNNDNSKTEQKCHDFTAPDNTMRSYFYSNQDKLSKSDKRQTSSPEFGKLLKILNSMELNETSTEIDVSKDKVDCRVSPVYENSVSLELKDDSLGPQRITPTSYTSSISMLINDDDYANPIPRPDKDSEHQSLKEESQTLLKTNSNCRRYSLQMPFKEVSRDLEELQLSIRKAKEMRLSASRELHFLQELLSKDTHEDQEHVNEKNFSISQPKYLIEKSGAEGRGNEQETLADLRKNAAGGSDEESFWQEEIKRVKEENDAAWQSKLDLLEKKLASQEEELHMVQSANQTLQKQLELQTSISQTCHCRSDVVQNGVGRTDSAFEDDEDYVNQKSSIPIHSSRQECERLQEQLLEAEQRADQLNLLLNQRLIELNKLQLTLSKQTKEMIELEKSYLQLQYRQRKGTSKPVVAKLCSRTSPFNSKNLCPKPSPPATPNP